MMKVNTDNKIMAPDNKFGVPANCPERMFAQIVSSQIIALNWLFSIVQFDLAKSGGVTIISFSQNLFCKCVLQFLCAFQFSCVSFICVFYVYSYCKCICVNRLQSSVYLGSTGRREAGKAEVKETERDREIKR